MGRPVIVESFEDFLASITGRPGFEPWHLRLVDRPGLRGGRLPLIVYRGEGEPQGYVARGAPGPTAAIRGWPGPCWSTPSGRPRSRGA